jgi:hypothetical protein
MIGTPRTHIAVAILGALSLFCGMAIPQQAATTPAHAQTTPVVSPDWPAGYYIFQSGNTVQLITHGPGAQHEFDARLQTDGTFTDISTLRLENADHYALLDGGHTLNLAFQTYDFTDGIIFTVQGSDSVRMRLALDDHLASVSKIHLEPGDSEPASNPFTLALAD